MNPCLSRPQVWQYAPRHWSAFIPFADYGARYHTFPTWREAYDFARKEAVRPREIEAPF